MLLSRTTRSRSLPLKEISQRELRRVRTNKKKLILWIRRLLTWTNKFLIMKQLLLEMKRMLLIY